MQTTCDISAFDIGVDRNILSEYFGYWAIEGSRFQQLANRVQSMNMIQHVAQNVDNYDPLQSKSEGSSTPYAITGGVAQIEIVGSMMKYASSFSAAASTVRIRKQLRHAVANDEVKTIFLRMDTPGGTVSGTKDLADAVAAANAKKPVVAFVEDLCASAGYWVASQCSEIIANNETALIGSIGTYGVVADFSKQAEEIGVKVHVIHAGAFKGAGTPGTEITAEQLEDWQRNVDLQNAVFKSSVAKGRGFNAAKIESIADGRVHLASVALDMKLIDAIDTFENSVSRFTNQNQSRSFPMTTKPAAAAAESAQPESVASIEQLEGICADPAFVIAQHKAKATVTQATSAYAQKLKAENEAMVAAHATELAEVRQAAETAAQASQSAIADAAAGATAIETDANASSDADGSLDLNADVQWADAVEAAIAKQSSRIPEDERRSRARASVAKSNPELHRAYLMSTNPKTKTRRMLAEKYDMEGTVA